jgi:DNA-binding protein HU-beta
MASKPAAKAPAKKTAAPAKKTAPAAPAKKTAAAPAAKKAAGPKGPITKTALIAHFSDKFSLSKNQVKDLLDELADLAAKQAKVGFTIPGIGKLVVREYKAREGRNPRTGEKIKIKARKRLKFVISASVKKAAGFEK